MQFRVIVKRSLERRWGGRLNGRNLLRCTSASQVILPKSRTLLRRSALREVVQVWTVQTPTTSLVTLRRLRATVIVPARNEAATIKAVLRDLHAVFGACVHVVVVADQCSDDTAALAASTGAAVVKTPKGQQGLGGAFQLGVGHAVATGAEIVCNIDADGQYRAADLLELIAAVEAGADLAVGNRFAAGRPRHMSRTRYAANLTASWCFLVGTGVKRVDVQSGVRASRASTLQTLVLHERFTYTQEQVLRSARSGLGIVSRPVEFRSRISGRSRLTRFWPRYAMYAVVAAARARLA